MDKARLIELLKFYPHISDEISLYTSILNSCNDSYSTVKSPTFDNVPKGSVILDPTAAKAVRAALDGAGNHIQEIEEYISRLRILQSEIFKEFKSLPYHQKQVVYLYYLDGRQWVWIAGRLHYSERQCKRIRDAAIVKMTAIFGNNQGISSFPVSK